MAGQRQSVQEVRLGFGEPMFNFLIHHSYMGSSKHQYAFAPHLYKEVNSISPSH